MALLQVNIGEKLNKAIKEKRKCTMSPLLLDTYSLVKSFMKGDKDEIEPGNIFNAYRDNKGKGIKIDDLIDLL